MRHNRFLVTENLAENPIVITATELVHQVTAVLKLAPGEQVVLFNDGGAEVIAELILADKRSVTFAPLTTLPQKKNTDRQVTLYCALLKSDNFEWVVQKAVECGVSAIVPLITDHVVKRDVNAKRIERIVREAVEQSGRVSMPTVGEPIVFTEAMQNAPESVKIFFDRSPVGLTAADVVKMKSAALFIGPEGGWSERERELGKNSATVRSLGDTVLRAETAATVATYLAVHF